MNSPIVRGIQATLDKIDKTTSYSVFSACRRFIPKIKPALVGLEWSCNGLVWLAATILFIVVKQEQSTMLPKLLIGLVTDVIYVATIKALARRRRPTYAYQRDQMIVASVDKHSFPSGHCSRAAYVAFFVGRYFSHSAPMFSFLVNIWTTNVCISRVLLGRHHILDCVAGVVLGWFNYRIQFSPLVPINYLGLACMRAVFGLNAFSDPNDIEGMDAFVD